MLSRDLQWVEPIEFETSETQRYGVQEEGDRGPLVVRCKMRNGDTLN